MFLFFLSRERPSEIQNGLLQGALVKMEEKKQKKKKVQIKLISQGEMRYLEV